VKKLPPAAHASGEPDSLSLLSLFPKNPKTKSGLRWGMVCNESAQQKKKGKKQLGEKEKIAG
jgi:hypothetical protein